MSDRRYRLNSIKLSGFRAFPQSAGTQEFLFDAPCTVFYGAQGGGKSSSLCALEWAFFGEQIAKKSTTGIQERKYWMIRHRLSEQTKVEVSMKSAGHSLRLLRERDEGQKRAKDSLTYWLDGQKDQQKGENYLALMGLDLSDYMSCIHLHQELISDFITQDPRVRKGALDRLMGLTELSLFLQALKKVRVRPLHKGIEQEWQGIDQRLKTKLEVRDVDMREAKRSMREVGLNVSSKKQVIQACHELIDSLYVPFESQLTEWTKPDVIEELLPGAVKPFVEAIREGIRIVRNQDGTDGRVKKYQQKQLRLQGELAGLEVKQERFEKLKLEHFQKVEGKGRVETLEQSLKACQEEGKRLLKEQERRSKHLAFLEQAIGLLRGGETEGNECCPLCQKEDFQAEQALKNLLEVRDAQADHSFLEKREQNKKEVQQFSKDLAERQDQILQLKQAGTRLLTDAVAVWEALGEGLDGLFEPDEDPLLHTAGAFSEAQESFVQRAFSILSAKLKMLALSLEKAGETDTKEPLLQKVEDRLEGFRRLRELFAIREELLELEALKKRDEYQGALDAKSALQEKCDHFLILQKGVEQAIQRQADLKLRRTEKQINEIYQKLAGRKDLPRIAIDPEKYEVIACGEGIAEPALRFLNKGDINCAALSIFLALAASEDLQHQLDFILLDDPTQFMDQAHQLRLVQVIRDLLPNKQIVIATSDPYFREQLQVHLGHPIRFYEFDNWDLETGPQIQTELFEATKSDVPF